MAWYATRRKMVLNMWRWVSQIFATERKTPLDTIRRRLRDDDDW